ncbi:MAG: DNA-directed RNA polymerase subunit omega [Clostridiaceae bacterium]
MNNSMINPSIVDLLKKVDNRYSLVIVSSKRARQLIDGKHPLVEVNSKKPLTIAINEINEGDLTYEQVKEGYK